MNPRRVAITGAEGQLGRQLVAAFAASGWEVLGSGHARLDITRADDLRDLTRWRPRVAINAAAWTDVDGCARDPGRAMAVNGLAAGRVAAATAAAAGLTIQVSTNEVFDGGADRPYAEEDVASPINPYGASKLRGEQEAAAANPRHLIVRTAWIFGPGGRNFPSKIIEVAQRLVVEGEPLRVVADEIGNPTWAPDLAEGIRAAAEAFLDDRIGPGVLHLAGDPAVSRHAWAVEIVAELDGIELVPIATADYPRPSRVPLRAALDTSRARSLGIVPSDWRTATRLYASDLLARIAG